MAFSPDSKNIITQGGAPDWNLEFWIWEKARGALASISVVHSEDFHNKVVPTVQTVSFNPFDNTQICVTGQHVLKLYRYSDGGLKQLSFAKMAETQKNFLCQSWIGEDRLVVGTDASRVCVFESGELVAEVCTPPLLLQSKCVFSFTK